MKRINLKYIFAAALAGMMAMPMQAQKKERKTFYDSKSNLVGVTGEYRLLGDDRHFYEVEVNLPGVDSISDPKQLCQYWNEQNLGRKVLDELFRFNGESLSEDWLKEMAMKNVLKSDDERAAFGVVDKETILREDYLPLLENNYIFIMPRCDKNAKPRWRWTVFKVNIDKDILDQVFNSWNDMEKYQQIQVPITLCANDKKARSESKKWNLKRRRNLGRKVEAFAIRGQVVSRNPFMVNIGSQQNLESRDRMGIYRAKQKKNGEMYSSRVSTVRACNVTDSTARLYTFAGGRASYKKGDVAVYEPSHNTSLAITGGYQDHSYDISLTIDKRLHLSSRGVSTYFMGMVGGGTYEHFGRLYATNTGALVNTPFFVNAGLGYGVGYEFAHSMEIEPYLIGQWESVFFTKKEASQLSGSTDRGERIEYASSTVAHSVRIPVGARLSINIWYPVQLVLGAEYIFRVKIPYAKDTETKVQCDPDNFFFNPTGYKRDGLHFYGGLRFNF